MAAPKKAAGKKAPAKKTTKKAEPSMRSAAAKARGAAEDVSVVVTSKVRQVLRNLDMRTDSELIHAVNTRVQEMLTSAADRAKQNKRSTVRPHDL